MSDFPYEDFDELRASLREIASNTPTLRDQFAMEFASGNFQAFLDCDVLTYEEIAADCYKFADAMLKARQS